MKTAEEKFIDALLDCRFIEDTEDDKQVILNMLKVYNAGAIAEHEAKGIKAKALRIRGNPEKWIRYDARINRLIIEAAPCPIYQFEEAPILPADAELVDITIIVKEGDEG